MAYTGPGYITKTAPMPVTAGGDIDFTGLFTPGDRLFIVATTANETFTAPTGFTEITDSPQGQGLAASSAGVSIHVFTRVAESGDTTFSIGAIGNFQYVIGFVTDPSDIEDTNGSDENLSGSGVFGGVSTAGQALILNFVATNNDTNSASWSAQANADLASITERHDAGTTNGQGGGIMLVTGTREAAGTVGNTTATQSNTRAYCWVTVALTYSSGGTTYNDSLTESAAATEASTTAAIFPNAQSETVASTVAEAAATTHRPSISETLAASDSSATSATFAAAATETVTGADTSATAATWPSALAESLAANDNAVNSATMLASRAETVIAADDAIGNVVGGAATYNDVLTESVSANDVTTVASTIAAARAESVASIEVAEAASVIEATRAETVAANDDEADQLSAVEALSEQAAPSDNYEGEGGGQIEPPPVPPGRRATISRGNRAATGQSDRRHATTMRGKRAA